MEDFLEFYNEVCKLVDTHTQDLDTAQDYWETLGKLAYMNADRLWETIKATQ